MGILFLRGARNFNRCVALGTPQPSQPASPLSLAIEGEKGICPGGIRGSSACSSEAKILS